MDRTSSPISFFAFPPEETAAPSPVETGEPQAEPASAYHTYRLYNDTDLNHGKKEKVQAQHPGGGAAGAAHRHLPRHSRRQKVRTAPPDPDSGGSRRGGTITGISDLRDESDRDGMRIVLDLKRMRRIRDLDADNLRLEVESGVIGERLERMLNARGFTPALSNFSL